MDKMTTDCGTGSLCLASATNVRSDESSGAGKKSPHRILHLLPGWLLALGGLLWVLHDLNPGALRDHLAQINWWWMAGAIVADVLSYACQGWRWQQLLRPVARLTPARATQAIYAGLFLNEILPLRPGELVRACLVARWSQVKVMMIVPSMVAERLFDAVWLAAGTGLTAIFAPLPADLKKGAALLGLLVIVSAALFAWLVLRQSSADCPAQTAHYSRVKLWRAISSPLSRMSSELGRMGRTRAFYTSFILSLVFLFLQMIAFWLVLRGCRINLPFLTGAAVFLIVHLGTAIPNAPANVGAYQFFTVSGLVLFGVDKTAATSFSFVVFVLLTLPLLALGFMAISHSGLTLQFIRKQMNRQEPGSPVTA